MTAEIIMLWIAVLLVGLSAYWLGVSHRKRAEAHFKSFGDYCIGKTDNKPKDSPQ